jgi:NADPH:quinone reductase-like Zn-dependent oxidoreductase
MKAFVLRSYGAPDVLELTDLDRPVPGDGEVLVRVRATSINPYDWHHVRGEPYIARLLPGTVGLRRPKLAVLGCDLAGQVEAVGRSVTGFRPGDDVYALVPGGGFAEYAAVPASLLAPKPRNLTYEQAAAVPMAGVTALLGLREAGRLQPGQQVLVNGASGGVGTFAVQIARALGATVTGVCGPANLELVRSLGAQDVIDYRTADFTRAARRWDLLLDSAGSRPVRACGRVLAPGATMVLVGGPAGRWLQPAGRMFAGLAVAPLVPQRVAMVDAVGCRDKGGRLTELTGLIEDGQVSPVIDRGYPFAEIPAAVRYQEAGHARGKVVVSV